MSSNSGNKPTYTTPVAICAGVLFFGSLLLTYLMATRDMAPPRKYEVDMTGTIIGVDTTSKIPVLTKEEAKEVEIKENKKVDYVEPPKTETEDIPAPEPITLPSAPPPIMESENAASAAPTATAPKTESKIQSPKIEPIE